MKKKNSYHLIINEAGDKKAQWYVVHTYSGREERVAEALAERIKTMGLEDRVFEILIPTQEKIKIEKGKKKKFRARLFPGYLLIKMILDDDSFLTVRTTEGVTDFIGAGRKPLPLKKKKVELIRQFGQKEAPQYQTAFSVGEAVKIKEGPFADFLGTVREIDKEKGKVKVLVSIFGRETPVELDFLQVDKIKQ